MFCDKIYEANLRVRCHDLDNMTKTEGSQFRPLEYRPYELLPPSDPHLLLCKMKGLDWKLSKVFFCL